MSIIDNLADNHNRNQHRDNDDDHGNDKDNNKEREMFGSIAAQKNECHILWALLHCEYCETQPLPQPSSKLSSFVQCLRPVGFLESGGQQTLAMV